MLLVPPSLSHNGSSATNGLVPFNVCSSVGQTDPSKTRKSLAFWQGLSWNGELRGRHSHIGDTEATAYVFFSTFAVDFKPHWCKCPVENEPLIPANTLFFMTTNLELLPESSSSSDGQPMVNTHANERYFERPEVMESYRLQQSIETPDFTELSQTHVGGRFRPRGSDDVRGYYFLQLRLNTDTLNDYMLFPFYVSISYHRPHTILQTPITKSGIASTRPWKNASVFERRSNSSMSNISSRRGLSSFVEWMPWPF